MGQISALCVMAILLATPAVANDERERDILVSFLERNQCSGSKPELKDAFGSAGLDPDLTALAIFRLVGSGEAIIVEGGRMVLLQNGEVCGQFAIVAEPFDPAVKAALIAAYEQNSCVLELTSPQFTQVIDQYSEAAFQNTMSHLLSRGQIEMSGTDGQISTYIGTGTCES